MLFDVAGEGVLKTHINILSRFNDTLTLRLTKII